MKQLLWVGIGGFLGSIARYKLGGFVLSIDRRRGIFR